MLEVTDMLDWYEEEKSALTLPAVSHCPICWYLDYLVTPKGPRFSLRPTQGRQSNGSMIPGLVARGGYSQDNLKQARPA